MNKVIVIFVVFLSKISFGMGVPIIIENEMKSIGCSHITNFYDNTEVVSPTFSLLEDWQGDFLVSFLCIKNDGIYSFIRKISIIRGQKSIHFKLSPWKSECPSHLKYERKPVGIKLTEYVIKDSIEYSEDSIFSQLKNNTQNKRFLTIENISASGQGELYYCKNMKWNKWINH